MFNVGPVWGIDIGDSALKAVKLKPVGKQIVLQDFQIVSYADVSGDAGARREGQVPDALRALQAVGLGRHDKCFVSIAPQTVFSRFISLPPVDRRRIPEIVLYEARQQIPFSLNEVIWSYETVRKEFIPGEEIEIGLFAVKREVIDAYLADVSPIWNQLHGIQIAPLALYNFMRYEADIEQPTVIMDIGAQSTDLLIVDGEKFWLRNLPIAGNSFTSVLQKRLNIPRAEAEKLKRGVAESRHRRRLLEVLRPVMRDLVSEIQRSIGYYKSLSQEVKFENIIVQGEGYKLFGLDRFLTDQLQYKLATVQTLEKIPFQGARERVKELESALPSLGVALGLALQGLHHSATTINLIPDEFVIQRELRTKRFSGLIAAGLVWAIVGCLFLSSGNRLSEVAAVEKMGTDTLGKVQSLGRDLREAQGEVTLEFFKEFEQLGVNREYRERMIGALSSVLPKDVRIDQIRFYAEGAGERLGVGERRRVERTSPGRAMDLKDQLMRGSRREFDRDAGRGMRTGEEARGPTEDEKAVAAAELRVAFEATCDEKFEARKLELELPRELKKATVYGEEVPIVTGVRVGTVLRDLSQYSLDELGQTQCKIHAPVEVGLLTAEQAATRRVQARKEAEKTEKASAGSAAESARPSDAVARGARR